MSDLYIDIASSIAARAPVAQAELTVQARELAARCYLEERNAVYRYLVALGTNPSEAQDLTQETFLKLYVALCHRRQIENVRAWLFTVASRLALNQRRWWRYRPPASEEDVARWMRSERDPQATPEETLLHQEAACRLDAAISGLSRQQQACLQLRAEGFRYREIARILGISLTTVAEFLHRAIAGLKKALHE
jgi:RNA polymerase sigma-70 factor (ECF subfamily)